MSASRGDNRFPPVSFCAVQSYEKGDVNRDGKIDITDVTAIQGYLAELLRFDKEQLALADFDGDGSIDVCDATGLQIYIAGITVPVATEPTDPTGTVPVTYPAAVSSFTANREYHRLHRRRLLDGRSERF